MAAFAGRKFTVNISNSTEQISRASRRIIIHSELLKQSKVYSGDVVAISSAESPKVRLLYLAFSCNAGALR